MGAATDDKTSRRLRVHTTKLRVARSQPGAAPSDAAKEMTDTGSIPDLSRLRDDIAKLTQTVFLIWRRNRLQRPGIRWPPWARLWRQLCRNPPR